MELVTKEVRFDIWCDRCKHKDKSEKDDPCWDCLDEPVNEHSTKPLYFEEENK